MLQTELMHNFGYFAGGKHGLDVNVTKGVRRLPSVDETLQMLSMRSEHARSPSVSRSARSGDGATGSDFMYCACKPAHRHPSVNRAYGAPALALCGVVGAKIRRLDAKRNPLGADNGGVSRGAARRRESAWAAVSPIVVPSERL